MDQDLKNLGMSDEELFSLHDHSDLESEKITAPRYSYWHSVFRVFFRNKLNIAILALLVFVIAFAYIYPAVTHYDQFENLMDAQSKHLNPAKALNYFGMNLKWILGTGAAGQSTFQSIWNGSRISISLAFICAAINMTVGVIVGAIWGFSKKVDAIMMEVYNIIANVPYILLISVMVMLFSASFWTMVLALTVKIAMKNILPFMTSVIVTLLATEIPSYISYEVFLSYIGMGLSDMSLGRLIYEAESAMVTPGWEFEFWSPVAISAIISVVLYVVGQNLGDASDPRTHM